MGRISSGVSTEGPVNAGVVAWRVGPRVRATVIVKACLEFGTSGHSELVRPLPIFVKDRVGGTGELNAPSDLAPFVPSPEVMLIGRALHRHGFARVGFRLERGGATIVEKHVDASANAILSSFAPQRSVWPVPPESFEAGVVTLPSLDGAPYQRCAADQRATELRGNEELVLIGLYPNSPLLRVPLYAPTVEATALSGDHVDAVPLRIDAIIVTLADRKCTILWRGSVPLRSEEARAPLRIKVVAKADPRAEMSRVREPAAPSAEDVSMGTIALPDPQGADPRGGVASESFETITLPVSEGPATPFQGAPKRPTLPFSKSQPPPLSERAAASRVATPWGGDSAPSKSVVPASSGMSTLPIEDEPAPEPARTPAVAAQTAAASFGSGPAPAVEPTPPDPDKPVWREDPSAVAAPPPTPSVAPKLVKKDLNAQLYKRPKLKR